MSLKITRFSEKSRGVAAVLSSYSFIRLWVAK